LGLVALWPVLIRIDIKASELGKWEDKEQQEDIMFASFLGGGL
jgi:hypothetical protein